jgi:hypothetical protein
MYRTVRRVVKGKARSESQQKLYKIMTIPTAMCESGTWIVIKNQDTRMQTAEIKFFVE